MYCAISLIHIHLYLHIHFTSAQIVAAALMCPVTLSLQAFTKRFNGECRRQRSDINLLRKLPDTFVLALAFSLQSFHNCRCCCYCCCWHMHACKVHDKLFLLLMSPFFLTNHVHMYVCYVDAIMFVNGSVFMNACVHVCFRHFPKTHFHQHSYQAATMPNEILPAALE